MKNILKEWREFIKEDYNINAYELTCVIKVLKTAEIDKTKAATEIRAVPGVTVATVVPDTAREDASYYYQTLNVKFCCVRPIIDISPKMYVTRRLIPAINKIEGLFFVKSIGKIKKREYVVGQK